jgi:hypothetical protein
MFAGHRVVAVALLVAFAAGRVHAQLPSVQQVYDQYATAMGGRAAWEKVSDRAEKGTANLAFAGMTATYQRYYSAPNKFKLIMDLGAVGTVEQATDGTTAWNTQPGGAPTKLPAEDAAYVNEASVTGAAFLDPSRFAKAAVAGKETFDGVECLKVDLVTKAGRARTDYFEVSTGLRRGQVLKLASGEQTSVFRDYKAFDGKQMPTTIVQSNPQGDIVITITSVTFTPNDPALFVVPAGISK